MTRAILLASLALAAACVSVSERGEDAATRNSAATHERQILLTVHQDRSSISVLRGAPAQRYQYRRGYTATPFVERVLSRLASEHGLRRVRGWPIASLDVYCEVFEIPDDRNVSEVLDALNDDPDVDIAQRMNTFTLLASRYDDPFVDLQTSIDLLDVEAAHEMATGKGVLVALIDSGVERDHPELRHSVRMQRDLVDDRRARTPGEVHGTAIAGIIASAANNAEGIVGVAPDAEIAALRACWSETAADSGAVCSSFSLAQAMEAALEIEPGVINLSLAGPEDPLLGRLIDRAVEDGIAVVAARHENDAQLPFPASHRGVIAVQSSTAAIAAGDASGVHGPSIEVLSTVPGNDYAFFSGSSVAAAHVSGVVALVLERQPHLGSGALYELLRGATNARDGVASVNACVALAGSAAGGRCRIP